jgi:hypothetical protein
MKKRLLLVLALITALSLVAAAPVSADGEKPINGKMDLTLELEPCLNSNPTGPFVTWVGTVVIDGTTYGWADFPTADLAFEKKFVYFEEYWTVFTLEPGEDPTVELACDPTLVVLGGFNDGRGTPGGAARADGTVTSAAGLFADVAEGSRMIWRGKVTNFRGDADEFKATLHIFPLK